MKIICVVKFVPDVDNFTYDHEKHIIIRENSRMMVNPDDACAVGFALNMKQRSSDTSIEVVTMAPESVLPLVEDILRVGVDTATVISDRLYAGSDTYATSRVLSRYLSGATYDTILTGSHAIDGDTSHVPSQLACLLDMNHMSFISRIDETSFSSSLARFEVEGEHAVSSYEIQMPAILGLSRTSGYRLPYVRYKNLNMDVSDRVTVIHNDVLCFDEDEVGLTGSRTKVVRTHVKTYKNRSQHVVTTDQEGIDTVYRFLKEKRFI